MAQDLTTHGSKTANGVATPYAAVIGKDHTTGFYAQYTLGNLRFDGEYRRNFRVTDTTQVTSGALATNKQNADARYGYVAVAYRLNRWLEVGTYHGRYLPRWDEYHGDPHNHEFDQAITARFDLRSWWDLKIEGHFIDGYSRSSSDRGFYKIDNPNGRFPTTNLFVLRMGFHS
jgi:hypothetical protein